MQVCVETRMWPVVPHWGREENGDEEMTGTKNKQGGRNDEGQRDIKDKERGKQRQKVWKQDDKENMVEI